MVTRKIKKADSRQTTYKYHKPFIGVNNKNFIKKKTNRVFHKFVREDNYDNYNTGLSG